MKQKPLAEFTIDELKKQQKLLQFVVGFLGAAIVIITASGIFLSVVNKSFSFFNITGLCFLPIFIINSSGLKKIKAEIKSRNA